MSRGELVILLVEFHFVLVLGWFVTWYPETSVYSWLSELKASTGFIPTYKKTPSEMLGKIKEYCESPNENEVASQTLQENWSRGQHQLPPETTAPWDKHSCIIPKIIENFSLMDTGIELSLPPDRVHWLSYRDALTSENTTLACFRADNHIACLVRNGK